MIIHCEVFSDCQEDEDGDIEVVITPCELGLQYQVFKCYLNKDDPTVDWEKLKETR